ncbi:MAG: TfoX/Sxy family protein [Eubacterium sp.]|nr:TfoX/Sxy family protein [Eubacterium sp.]
MASDKEYLDFVLEQLSELDGISSRSMMGEYIIYYKGKVIGGIYDNRFLVKNTKSAAKITPETPLELPYEGAKKMLLADIDNKDLMNSLIPAVYDDLC